MNYLRLSQLKLHLYEFSKTPSKASHSVVPGVLSCDQTTRKVKKREGRAQWVFLCSHLFFRLLLCWHAISCQDFPEVSLFLSWEGTLFLGLIRSGREGSRVWRISSQEKLSSFSLQLIQSRTQDRVGGVCQGAGSFPSGQGQLSRSFCHCTKEEGMVSLAGSLTSAGTALPLWTVWDKLEGHRWFPLLLSSV